MLFAIVASNTFGKGTETKTKQIGNPKCTSQFQPPARPIHAKVTETTCHANAHPTGLQSGFGCVNSQIGKNAKLANTAIQKIFCLLLLRKWSSSPAFAHCVYSNNRNKPAELIIRIRQPVNREIQIQQTPQPNYRLPSHKLTHPEMILEPIPKPLS